MAALRFFLTSLGVILLVATALPLVRAEAWWIRAFDFPRAQIAFLLVGIIVVYAAAVGVAGPVDALFLAALAVAAFYQTLRVFPYTKIAGKQSVDAQSCEGEARLRMLVANVLMDNRRADDFIALVRENDPDVVLALETDLWWDRRLAAALDKEYRFSVKHPRDNTYGMHLFSRLELIEPQLRFLVDDDVPSIRTGVRLRSGASFDLYCVHPRPPRPPRGTERRDAEILIVAREVKERQGAAVVAGDLNDVAWSRTTNLFQKVSGMLDPRVGRGPCNTFNAKLPGLRWALDHVFHEKSFAVVEMRRLGYFGSDHFPVFIELCHEPRARAAQEPPHADEKSEAEAGEKIRNGLKAGC